MLVQFLVGCNNSMKLCFLTVEENSCKIKIIQTPHKSFFCIYTQNPRVKRKCVRYLNKLSK